MFSVLISSLIAQAQPGYNLPQLPPGASLSAPFIITGILTPIANFLIAAGIILGIITIVVSGIMFFWAKSDTDAKNAKAWFKNGVIGAFIILAVGVIILTIYNIVVTRTFFGGSSIPGPGPGPITGGPPGTPCTSNSQCMSGTTCDAVSGMCVRSTGNLEGEPCRGDGDCSPDLRCRSSGIFGTGPKTCQKP